MNKKIVSLLCLLILFNAYILIAQELTPELENMYEQKLEYKKDIYNRILKFINENPDSPGLANLYFYLAELSTEVNVNDPAKTVKFYRRVLEEDPSFLQKDAVLYNIGYYGFQKEVQKRNEKRLNNLDLVVNWPDSLRLTLKNLDYVVYSLKELVVRHPDSDYFTRAAYRLGVVYFELALDAREPQKFFTEAIKYFDQVADQVDDPLHYLGIFQRAWTYFTSGKFQESLVDFTYIVNLIEKGELEDYKTFFEDDAVENCAYSLIEYDGTDFEDYSEAAGKAKKLFSNILSDTFGKRIIKKAIELKLKYNAPMQAADFYNVYVDLYPTSIEAPSMIDSVMSIYKSYPSRTRGGVPAEEMVIQEYERLVDEFNVDSGWYQANKDKDITAQLNIIKEAYEFLEPKYFNAFVNEKNEDNYLDYKQLVDNYTNYQAIITEEKKKQVNIRIVQMSQDLAEHTNAPRYYLLAIKDIRHFIDNYPESDKISEYKEMIFYDYEQVYNILKPQVTEQAFQDSILNIVIDKNDLDSLFVNAASDYEDYLLTQSVKDQSTNMELVRIIYQKAELRYENEQYNKAMEDYSRLISLNINDEMKKIIYSRLAEISQQNNNYAKAEEYYREAAKYANAEEKEAFNNNILATKQAKANTFADSADFENAAQEYLELARELEQKNLDESIGFIVQAIENYQKAGNSQKAIELYLDIATKREQKDAILAAYINAWTISDSLGDWDQSETLRRQFINKFSDSNEAYKLRVQIIDFYENEDIYNDKEQAAEMYLTLHDDASSMDIGEVNPANIYLNAIRLYQELGKENKIIELSLQFEEMYPEHERANDLLVNVAKIYDERGDTKKFEEIAAHLYQKDPTFDLLVTVAAEKLKDIKAEVDSLFDAKQYDLMTSKIEEFNQQNQYYLDKGLELPTESIFETFNYYNNYIAYHQKFDDAMNEFQTGILGESPDELIRVNELTKWKDHLVAGRNRIPKLLQRCNSIKEETIQLIQEGNEYALKTEDRTEALYHVAQIFEHCTEAVKTQVQKFVDVSQQLNSERLQQNPVQQEQYKTAILAQGSKLSFEFLKNAVQAYNTILNTIVPNEQYSDRWTTLAYNRLVELGVRKPKVYEYLFTSNKWRKATKTNMNMADIADSLWNYVEPIEEAVVLDSANVLLVEPNTFTFYNVFKETEIAPELVTFEYIFQKPVDIFINGDLMEKEPQLQEELLQIRNDFVPHYVVTTTQYFKDGWNEINFRVSTDTLTADSLYFAGKIEFQYDEEQLEFVKTTESRMCYTDYSWVAHKGVHDFNLTTDLDENQAEVANTKQDSTHADSTVTDSTFIDSTAVDSLTVTDSTLADSTALVEEEKPELTNPSEETNAQPYEWVTVSDASFEYYKNQMYGLEESEAIGIWHPLTDTLNSETITLKKDLYIDNEIVEANLTFIGQKQVTVYINGETVVDSVELVFDTALKKVQANDIEINQLKPGNNEIIVEVTGDVKYQGFICELEYIVKKRQ